ncbi:hypothetical protein CHCC20375_0918 [Bacillus licheniformis]|nr:hypothetical protein CHCC20375_0918 [Bacillus licheniformis]
MIFILEEDVKKQTEVHCLFFTALTVHILKCVRFAVIRHKNT